MARATSSFPVPVSPSMITVAKVGAIFSQIPKICRIFLDFPTISPRFVRVDGSI